MYGACIVATIRGLDAKGLLNEDIIPSLEYFLNLMASWGSLMRESGCDDSCYDKVIKGFGVRLFRKRTAEERKQRLTARKRAYTAYVQSLSEAERTRRVATYVLPSEETEKNIDGQDKDKEKKGSGSKDNKDEGDAPGVACGEKKKSWFQDAEEGDIGFDDPVLNVATAWIGYKP